MTQFGNITTAFLCNSKQPTTDLFADNTEFQPYNVECKYTICSGIV